MPKKSPVSLSYGDYPTNPSRLNYFKTLLKNNDGILMLCIGTGSFIKSTLTSTPTSSRNIPTFQVLCTAIALAIIFPTSFLTTALPTRHVQSFTNDDDVGAAGLILKTHSTPMTVKVAFLRPRSHNLSTGIFNGGEYSASPSTLPNIQHRNVTSSPTLQSIPINDNGNNNDKDVNSATVPIFVISNVSESTTVPPKTTEGKNVNLAVIPVLGIFFLMILVCFKGCSWFREHLKEHDIEDDGKDYVILSPPEDGYREVEFRSDTSSMYYDTVSSYRSILRQKGEFGGYNNYDTVTSIRSILQRADVRDAAVQVRLYSRKPDRWKSVSGILNNGGGSNSDLLRVPKKSHRQVSFQTCHNESYDPPSPRMCDVNIQVGVSTMDRWKQQQDRISRFQNGMVARQMAHGHGSRGCLLSALPNRHSSASLRSMDKTEAQPLKRTDSTGVASTTSNSTITSAGSGATSKVKPRRFHHFQVLRVNSTDRLGSREIEGTDTPLQTGVITPHHIDENNSISGRDNIDIPVDPKDRYPHTGQRLETMSGDRHGELYGAPMTTMCHPHYNCDQFVQTDSGSANDTMSPATAAAHTSFTPPILTEVKFNRPLSGDDDLDSLEERKMSDAANQLCQLYVGEGSDTTGEESLMTSGRNSISWSEQMDEEDQLQKLLKAHASSIAGAPIASPVSMDSTSSSCHSSTDDLAQRVELDRNHDAETGDATTASEDSGEGRSGIDQQENAPAGDNDIRGEEETPLIEQSFADISSPGCSQSPDIGAEISTGTRSHRVSSGYDTQGPESSSIKGPAEAGDSSCDVTPLTSSSNSLQEVGTHTQPPLQLLMFQHLQLEDRTQAQKIAEFESQQQNLASHPRKDAITSKSKTVTAPTDQPLLYIPQLPPQNTSKGKNISTPPFEAYKTSHLTDKNNGNSEKNKNVQVTSTGSTPSIPIDCQDTDLLPDIKPETLKDPAPPNIDNTSGQAGSSDSNASSLQTLISNIKDNSRVAVVQDDEPLQTTARRETLPKVVNPLTTLPPPPPPPLPSSKMGLSANKAKKRANTLTDFKLKR